MRPSQTGKTLMVKPSTSGPAKAGRADSYAIAAGDDDVHALALDRFELATDHDRHNADAAYADLEFCDLEEQWPADARKLREDEKRPCQTFNRLPQFIRQITGDMRQMRPSIKVVPVDSGADKEVARIRAGLIRYIENRSDAQSVYVQGAEAQVKCGIGHWRVIKEYADDVTFNQELRVVAVKDGLGVKWDPDAVLPNKEDAKFCFVPVDFSHDKYKERWPGAPLSDLSDDERGTATGWYGADFVRVCEYWIKKPSTRTLALLAGGAIEDLTDDPAKVERYRAQNIRVETRESYSICRYLINHAGILEGPVHWPGRYIPIVRCVGEEVQIGRKTYRRGVVRFAKGAQQAYNYSRSQQTEIVALQPKAPYLGTEANFKGWESFWNYANVKAFPYLPYTPDPKNGGTAPQRVPPPVSSQGVSEAIALAAEDMKAIIGIYDAGLGARSNEVSGRAILARQREADIGSFVYQDNWSRAIRHTATILNDLIPHVYDAERTIRILGEDGKEQLIDINKAAPGDGTEETERVVNDVTVGAYDVVFQPGPSYSTRREEARDGMNSFIQAAPQVAPLVLDLIAEAQDWPMAERIGKRLETLLPPEVQRREAQERGEQGAAPPADPAQADPAQAASLQQAAQMQAAQMQAAHERALADVAEAQSRAQIARDNARKAAIDLQMKEMELARRLPIAPPSS